ncbi:MAG TPA: large conductance mechanosensitive channel protein MscL, partial [Micromonosporaceae bacterium]|nr:large conductance mechanosensitive channel protein MscL [Micromonosporaceae bacterium]
MRNLWREFKAFAISGNVLDLALGFLIGAAFAKLVESLADNVLMQFVAATGGKRDFGDLTWTVNNAEIRYGTFLTDLLNFLILAAVMFAVVKLVVRIGIARARSFGDDAQCPYCRESIATSALVCKACGRQLVDDLPSLADVQSRLVE